MRNHDQDAEEALYRRFMNDAVYNVPNNTDKTRSTAATQTEKTASRRSFGDS